MNRWKSILSLVVSLSAFAEQRPIWVIAHMTNSVAAVGWASASGANGVEADLRFDKSGRPTSFRHSLNAISEPCDCSCGTLAKSMAICQNLGDSPCTSEVAAGKWFEAVREHDTLRLVVIDSKVDKHTSPDAGTNVVRTLESELFERGYQGMVIIGSSSLDTIGYLTAAATAAGASRYADRMYFTIDGEGGRIDDVLAALDRLPSANLVYGTGISACVPKQFWNAILLSEMNRRAGVLGFNYIWTVDKTETALEYLEKGAGGIMTNDPATMADRLRWWGYPPPAKDARFPAATSKSRLTAVPACDCDHGRGGCAISRKAPAGWACRCAVTLPLTCAGSVVVCKDPQSPACVAPGVQRASCEQGGGNCGGYR